MTQVVSDPFTVQIVSSSRYASMQVGDTQLRWQGNAYQDYPVQEGQFLDPGTRWFQYSSITLNPISGKLYYFGGGHQDGWRNSVIELDVEAANSDGWREITTSFAGSPQSITVTAPALALLQASIDNINQPGAWISAQGFPQEPYTRHTGRFNRWIEPINGFITGGSSPYGDTGSWWEYYLNSPHDRWVFYPDALSWEYFGSSRLELLNGPTAQAWAFSRTRNRLYVLSNYQVTSHAPASAIKSTPDATTTTATQVPKIWEFNLGTKQWTQRAATYDVSSSSEWAMDVDEQTDEIIVLCIRLVSGSYAWGFHKYSIAQNSWSAFLPITGTFPVTAQVNSNVSFFKSTLTGNYLIVRNGNVYSINPTTGVSSVVATLPTPGTQAGHHIAWDRIRQVLFCVHIKANTSASVYAIKA